MHSSTLNRSMLRLEWLRQNRKIRELVVQSLRVSHVTYFARQSEVRTFGLDLLDEFGKEFRASPQRDTYIMLVREVISMIPAAGTRQHFMDMLDGRRAVQL